MVRIVALDDEQAYIEEMKRLTQTYFAKKNIPYVFQGYDNCEKLLWDMEEHGDIDLFLLDMELGEYVGLDVAKKIRQWNGDCEIVCVTNYMSYAPAAYEVNAFRYIMKKELKEKLFEMYDALLPRMLQKDERAYMMKTNSRVERLYYKEIVYLAKDKKYVVFHMRDGREVRVRGTLEEVEHELADRDFVRIDKGCIINLNHLGFWEGNECRMRDGTVLGISRARCRELKDRVMEFGSIEKGGRRDV